MYTIGHARKLLINKNKNILNFNVKYVNYFIFLFLLFFIFSIKSTSKKKYTCIHVAPHIICSVYAYRYAHDMFFFFFFFLKLIKT